MPAPRRPSADLVSLGRRVFASQSPERQARRRDALAAELLLTEARWSASLANHDYDPDPAAEAAHARWAEDLREYMELTDALRATHPEAHDAALQPPALAPLPSPVALTRPGTAGAPGPVRPDPDPAPGEPPPAREEVAIATLCPRCAVAMAQVDDREVCPSCATAIPITADEAARIEAAGYPALPGLEAFLDAEAP